MALNITERSSEDIALGATRNTMGVALVHRESPAERERGLAVLGQVRDMCLRGRFYLFMLPVLDVWGARERARCGDRDGAIPQMCAAIEDLFRSGQRVLRPGDRRSGGVAAGARCQRRPH